MEGWKNGRMQECKNEEWKNSERRDQELLGPMIVLGHVFAML